MFRNFIAVLLLVPLGACSSEHNKIYFPKDKQGWFVIVNHCDIKESNRQNFKFDSSKIMLLNNPDFHVKKGIDSLFWITENGIQNLFPNEVCYVTKSANSGFNASTFCKQCFNGLDVVDLEGRQQYDFYFFRVCSECSDNDKSLPEFFEEVFCYLCRNKIGSKKN